MRIPLILLLPILLLLAVVVAGVYRLSIGDEAILTKFSNQTDTNDVVMLSLFQIETPNKWVIEVPGRAVRTLVDYNPVDEAVYGIYQNGNDIGRISIESEYIEQIDSSTFVFFFDTVEKGQRQTYVALARFDEARRRLFSNQALLVGSNIVIQKVNYDEKETISIDFDSASNPKDNQSLRVVISDGEILMKHN